MPENFFVFGIDFGTTYSGVAYCWSGQPDDIELVTRWKSNLSFTSDSMKTPTEIHYDKSSGSQAWGYGVPIDAEPLRWFKLLLVDRENLPEEFRNSRQLSRASDLVKSHRKNPVDVVADYLRLLWNHTLEQLCRDRGESAIKGSKFKVWITVPAIWDERARERMLVAAKKAGILSRRAAGPTQLNLVAEPEAAALAVLNDFKGRPDVKAGDVFVVCDAGGGTVDVISYEVLSADPLRVRECVEGEGKLCGAIFVDEQFIKLVKQALGSKWEKTSEASRKMMVHNEWENGIKKLFDDSDKDWTVTVPPEAFDSRGIKLHRFDDKNAEVPLKSGQLRFGRGHVRVLFNRVFPHIRHLIHDQVKAVTAKKLRPPSAILLVGGLGACNYLYQELKAEYDPKNITVLQPNGVRPWTAICRGAVIRGLSATTVESANRSRIVARVSRLSYGINYTTQFDEKKHNLQDRYWCDQELVWKARGQMKWFLRRGNDIYDEKPVVFDAYKLFRKPSELEDMTFTINVFTNHEQRAPTRQQTGTVQLLAHITVRVDEPFDQLPKFTNSEGTVFREVEHDIEMTTDGTSMDWKVLVNGEVSGRQNITIERGIDSWG